MMASLIVVAVNMAFKHGDSRLIAEVLRRNAEMLELGAPDVHRCRPET